jgi:hypothetical protein
LERRALQERQVLRQQGEMAVIQYSLLLPRPEVGVVVQETILLNPVNRMVEMVAQVVVLRLMLALPGLVIPPQHLPCKDMMVAGEARPLMVARGVVVLVLLAGLIRGIIIAVVLAALVRQTQLLGLLLLMA